MHMKRQKISKACDICRKQKRRCTGTSPCTTCERLQRDCTYSKRHLAAHVGLSDRSASNTTPLQTAGQTVDEPLRSSPDGSLIATERQTLSWRSPSTEVGEEDATGNAVGPFNPFSWLYQAWKQLGKLDADLDRRGATGTQGESQMLSYGDRISNRTTGNSDNVQLSQISTATLDLVLNTFFDRAMATYHFLHYPTIRTWILEMRDPHGSINNDVREAVSLLALAHGFIYLKTEESNIMTSEEVNALLPDNLVERASRILEMEQGSPKLESVQARLIKVHHSLSSSQPTTAYYLFGVVVQMTYALGMHQKQPRHNASSLLATELRRRLFWAVYATDRYLSIALGRPPLINDDIISQEYPTAINDEDLDLIPTIANPDRDCVIEASIQHAALARIVGRGIQQYYAVTSSLLLEAISKNNTDLTRWKSQLPTFLSGAIRPSSLVPVFQRQAVVLETFYLHAVILINRPCLLIAQSSPTSESDPTQSSSGCYDSCVEASLKIAKQIFRYALEGQKSQVFWFTQNVTFNAVSILYFHVLRNMPFRQRRAEGLDKVMEIASQAHESLAEISKHNAPNLRYTLVLDVLKQQIQKQQYEDSSGSIDEFITANSHPSQFGGSSLGHDENADASCITMEDAFFSSDFCEATSTFWPTFDMFLSGA